MNKKHIKKKLDEMKKLQSDTGSHDDYGQGLYNGIELARVVLLKLEKSEFIGSDEWKVRK